MWNYLFHKSMPFMKIPLREKTANWHQDESHGVIEARIWFKFGWILGKVMKVIRCCATLTCVQHFTRWNSGTSPPLLMILIGKEWVCYNILQIDTDWNHELTEKFNSFFKQKVEKLAAWIKKNSNIDPLSKLREKIKGSKSKFSLRTVKEIEVLKLMKQLKSKKSCGHDGSLQKYWNWEQKF